MTTEYLEKPDPFAEIHVEDPPPKCYVSGPMTGIPRFNFPAFDSLTAHLRSRGWDAYSPAEGDRHLDPECETRDGFEEGSLRGSILDVHTLMRIDLKVITESQAIVFLPGWEKSTGAKIEKTAAEGCGLSILYAYPASDALLERIPDLAAGFAGEWWVSATYYPELS